MPVSNEPILRHAVADAKGIWFLFLGASKNSFVNLQPVFSVSIDLMKSDCHLALALWAANYEALLGSKLKYKLCYGV